MPRPLRILTLLLGLVLITAAALDLITLQQRADRIRATGVPVSAGVLHPSIPGAGSAHRTATR
ncbi:hypothetical protein [Actinoplanes awajinensis]|uniref:Uncharacterized protein n=1 Tax=Actinoplanes awajinensis subsp. mycoplanecinus TaxID=135947 RepID=A0A101J8Y7_9ACTN|nr:hypothetical protein [Actinoplanes awajinensis]KUL22384.1 hypothetical protein ADL15_48500 [Actinoplanes awajinensis subsp. mycoplanecinus]